MATSRQREIARALEGERARALGRIEALTRDLHEIIEGSNDAARDDEHDPEGNTIAFERAQVAALLEAARLQLDDIEVAQGRLAAGEHHRCAACGAAIPEERHDARPTARTCVRCAGQSARSS